jgi:NADH-ubiquinone oxidoreductase chain 6
VSVLFLIALFLNISAYLILIGIHFLGLSYLLVYVGAVSILFLFVIMLINIRVSELHSNTRNSIPLGFIVSIAFYFPVYNLIRSTKSEGSDLGSNIDIQYVTSSKWDVALSQHSDISSIGNLLYTSHSIWLILTGLILLLAMVGAIAITVSKSDRVYK